MNWNLVVRCGSGATLMAMLAACETIKSATGAVGRQLAENRKQYQATEEHEAKHGYRAIIHVGDPRAQDIANIEEIRVGNELVLETRAQRPDGQKFVNRPTWSIHKNAELVRITRNPNGQIVIRGVRAGRVEIAFNDAEVDKLYPQFDPWQQIVRLTIK